MPGVVHMVGGGDSKRKAFECFLYLEDAEERVPIASAEGWFLECRCILRIAGE